MKTITRIRELLDQLVSDGASKEDQGNAAEIYENLTALEYGLADSSFDSLSQ